MANNITSVCKQCRRAGEKLFLRGERCNSPKCAIVKRNYPPGKHGEKGAGRLTQYGLQLKEKQKVKRIYGVNERQFHNYYSKAVKKIGNTEDALIKSLEMRFDNVVYRLGLASSRRQSRQMINHSFFLINNKPVNICSYRLKIKEVISVKPSKLKSKYFANFEKKLEKIEMPSWINWDLKTKSAKIISEPEINEFKNIINARMIIEFYSR